MGLLIAALLAGLVGGLAAVSWAFSETGYRLFGQQQVPAALGLYVAGFTVVSRTVLWLSRRRRPKTSPPATSTPQDPAA